MYFALESLPKVWAYFIADAGQPERTNPKILQTVIKDTYEAFYKYKDEKNVPMVLCEIVDNMKDYIGSLFRVSDMQTNNYAYGISAIVSAVLKGFLERNYECEFPILKISNNIEGTYLFDTENDDIDNTAVELTDNILSNF